MNFLNVRFQGDTWAAVTNDKIKYWQSFDWHYIFGNVTLFYFKLKDDVPLECSGMSLKHDGCAVHFERSVSQFLEDKFSGRWESRVLSADHLDLLDC